jgi:hypothetical protein
MFISSLPDVADNANSNAQCTLHFGRVIVSWRETDLCLVCLHSGTPGFLQPAFPIPVVAVHVRQLENK